MKLKDNLILRQVADTWVILPLTKDSLDFNGMLTLNESGALLWKVLERGADSNMLADALLAEYAVSREEAAADVDSFLRKLAEAGCLEQ